MAWTTPKTDFAPGDILNAAEMNAIGENLTSIINVVQGITTAKSTITSLAAGSISSDVITATITPSAATSKVLVTAQISVSAQDSTPVAGILYKGGSVVDAATGDADGSRSRITGAASPTMTDYPTDFSFVYLDSPGTTSATTYSVRLRHGSSLAKTITINSSFTDSNQQVYWRSISTLTLQEIPV